MASNYSRSSLGLLVNEVDSLALQDRRKLTPTEWRARIYRAAAQEAEYRGSINIGYDPAGDARFQWLCEWAEILEGTRRRHTSGLEHSMRFLFMEPGEFLSGKNLASGERPDRSEHSTFTLVQGS